MKKLIAATVLLTAFGVSSIMAQAPSASPAATPAAATEKKAKSQKKGGADSGMMVKVVSTSADGKTLTVKSRKEGDKEITLAENVVVTKEDGTTGSAADISSNARIKVTGESAGGAFKATKIEILPKGEAGKAGGKKKKAEGSAQ